MQENVDRIKALNPDWDYRFYDDAAVIAYLETNYPWAVDYWHRIDARYGAARADWFRYLLMYREGGVYLDIKSGLEKPLDEVIQDNDRFLLSHWRNGKGSEHEGWGIHRQLQSDRGEFQQWHIVCEPGHPYLRAAIDRVRSNLDNYSPYRDGVGHGGVLYLTGPISYTLAIQEELAEGGHRLVEADTDLGFVYSIFPKGRRAPELSVAHYSVQTVPILRLSKIRHFLLWMKFHVARMAGPQPG